MSALSLKGFMLIAAAAALAVGMVIGLGCPAVGFCADAILQSRDLAKYDESR